MTPPAPTPPAPLPGPPPGPSPSLVDRVWDFLLGHPDRPDVDPAQPEPRPDRQPEPQPDPTG